MSEMCYRVLGLSGLEVSRICLGTMMFGGPTDEAEAGRIVADAQAHGVNFIDTADAYWTLSNDYVESVWWLVKPREMFELTRGGHLELVSEFEARIEALLR